MRNAIAVTVHLAATGDRNYDYSTHGRGLVKYEESLGDEEDTRQ